MKPGKLQWNTFLVCLAVNRMTQASEQLTVNIKRKSYVFQKSGNAYWYLCSCDTEEPGDFPDGDSPLTWSSSPRPMPKNHSIKTSSLENFDLYYYYYYDVDKIVTQYSSRLTFIAEPSSYNLDFKCTATIGNRQGSKTVRNHGPLFIKPKTIDLTGPSYVKAGKDYTYMCESSGGSYPLLVLTFLSFIEQLQEEVEGCTKPTRIDCSIDAYGNSIYTVTSTCTKSLPVTKGPLYTMECYLNFGYSIPPHGWTGPWKTVGAMNITICSDDPITPTVTKEGGDSVSTVENVQTEIPCVVEPVCPNATAVQWTHGDDNTPIDLASPRYAGGTLDTPSLVITSPQPSDADTYVCHATNEVGEGMFATPTILVVQHKPIYEYSGNTTFEGLIGKSLTLPCNALAVPNITRIVWKRILNGKHLTIDIKGNVRYFGGDPGNFNFGLTINPLQETDGNGEYVCEAGNLIGDSRGPALTALIIKPTKAREQTTSTTIIVLIVLCCALLLLLLGCVIFKIAMRKRQPTEANGPTQEVDVEEAEQQDHEEIRKKSSEVLGESGV